MGHGSVRKFAKRLAPAALVLLLAVVWFSRAGVIGAVLRYTAAHLTHSQAPGLSVQFGSVDTNLVSRLRVNRLSLAYRQGGTCLTAQIPSVLISYSLTGIFPWRGLHSLVPQLAISIDSPTVTGMLAAGDPAASSSPELPALPILPALRVNDGSFDLDLPGKGTVSSRGIAFSSPLHLPGGQSPYELMLNAEHLAVAVSGLPRQEGALALTVRYRPGQLEVPELSFAGSPLLTDGLLAIDAQGVHFATGLHLLQSRGQVQGSVAQQQATLSFHLAEGNIEELAGVAGMAPVVGGQLKADGEMTMTMGQPETLSGTVKASVRNGSWDGAVIDRFEVEALAAGQKVVVESLRLAVKGSEVAIRDGEIPIPEAEAGGGAWRDALAASRGTIQLTLRDIEALPQSWSALLGEHWQALGLEEASAEATLDSARLRVAQAEVFGRAGRVRVKDGGVDLSAGVADWMAIPWSGQLQAELGDAAVIRYFWEDWPATGGTATGRGEFSGTLSDPHLPFTAVFTGSSLYGIPLAKVAGQLEWTKDRLALDVVAANREQDRLAWKGTIDLDKEGFLPTTVSTSVSDLRYYVPSDFARSLELAGPFTGTAALAGEFSRLKGEVKASGDWLINGVPLAGAAVDMALAGDAWSVRSLSGKLNSAVAVAASGRVIPGPGWQTFKVGLEALRLSCRGQELSLQGPAGMTVAADAITVVTPLDVQGPAGRFRVSGVLGGKGQLSLAAEAVRDTGLVREVWGKEIGFERLDFTLGLGRSEWRWQGAIEGLAAAGAPLALSGRFDLASDSQGLWIKQCELGDDGQSVILSGRLPLSVGKDGVVILPHPLNLKGHIVMPEAGIVPRLFPEWLAASGAIKADFALAGTWEHPQGQVQLDASGVEPGPHLHVAPPGPFAVHGLATVEKDQLTVSRFELSSSGFSVQASGTVSQLPLAGLVGLRQDTAGQSQLALTGRYSMADLGWLAARVKGVRRTGGNASGSFALTGPLARPEVRADLILVNGEARGSDSLLVARDISLKASLAEDQLTLLSLSGTLGGAKIQGEGMIKGVFAPDPELDVRVTGKDLLLYRADGVKFRADSALVLAGTVKAPHLGGELRLTDSRVTRNVNWLSLFKPGTRGSGGNDAITLFSFTEPPLKDTRFNVQIRAAQPVVINNNVFKGGVRPDLTLAGTGELPYLSGVIYADSGLVTLPSGRLDMERGLVRFSDDSPERPVLEVQASGRVMGYDITAQVKGAYDEPEVTLSSSPPLANEDLLMLLLAGRQPVNGRTAASGMSSVAVYFGRGLLSRLLAGEDDEVLLLERLEVDVGRAVSLQGEPTVDARLKLTDMAWQKDTSLYLAGEKDVWDDYNAGLRVVFRFQ